MSDDPKKPDDTKARAVTVDTPAASTDASLYDIDLKINLKDLDNDFEEHLAKFSAQGSAKTSLLSILIGGSSSNRQEAILKLEGELAALHSRVLKLIADGVEPPNLHIDSRRFSHDVVKALSGAILDDREFGRLKKAEDERDKLAFREKIFLIVLTASAGLISGVTSLGLKAAFFPGL